MIRLHFSVRTEYGRFHCFVHTLSVNFCTFSNLLTFFMNSGLHTGAAYSKCGLIMDILQPHRTVEVALRPTTRGPRRLTLFGQRQRVCKIDYSRTARTADEAVFFLYRNLGKRHRYCLVSLLSCGKVQWVRVSCLEK